MLKLTNDRCHLEQIKKLYKEAFPKEERKPFQLMETLSEQGKMEILAIEEDGDFKGLCINMLVPGTDLALLDYFAISPEARNGGYGSRTIKLLSERFAGQRMIFEIEREDDAAPNAEQRRRRKQFYLRNGLRETGIFASCFGVPFELLVLSDGRSVTYEEYVAVLRETLGEEGVRMADPRLLELRGVTGEERQTDPGKEPGDRILVIIPAYNEAGSIRSVVDELIRDYPELDYLVVTDGSKDGTPDICAAEGYHFLRLPVNLGLAGCFQAGMKYAEQKGYSYAVQFDGDGQHRPEYILPMQRKMREGEGFDIVLGSRFLPLPGAERNGCGAASGQTAERSAKEKVNEVRGMRSVGSFLIRNAIRLTTGVTVTDPTCGLRMYNRKMIHAFAKELNYAPEPDTISFLIKNGARVAEVPVRVAERETGQSYLRPVSAAQYMLKMLTSILLVQNFRA